MGLLLVVVVCVVDERAKSHTSITQTQPEDLGVNSRVSCVCVHVCLCVLWWKKTFKKFMPIIQPIHTQNTHILSLSLIL